MSLERIQTRKTAYNDSGMSDKNSLVKAAMMYPERLSDVMTFLGGREDKKFPLSVITEGARNIERIAQREYTFPVQTRLKKTEALAVAPSSTTNVGLGGSIFYLTFKTKRFIKDYVLISADRVQVRIQGEPTPDGAFYKYPVRLINPDPAATMPASSLAAGTLFAQLFAPVGTDWSNGNKTNFETPAEVKQKLTKIRKSYTFSGDVRDQVLEVALPTTSGGYSKLWMDYQEWQFWLQWREEIEMLNWYAEQTYDGTGKTMLTDENGQPVVIGPGLLDQIVNKDYYSFLTTNRLEIIIGDLFYGMTDGNSRTVTLFTGTGGYREFDRAMKKMVGETNYRQFNDGKFVTGSGRNLTLTGFFTRYEHVDGHTVEVFKHPLFDMGAVAEASRRHPISGLPLESHRMVFVDRTSYEGQANLRQIVQKDNELVRWAVAGSKVPRGFGSDSELLRASGVDGAEVHFMKECGILLQRNDTSLDLQCVLS